MMVLIVTSSLTKLAVAKPHELDPCPSLSFSFSLFLFSVLSLPLFLSIANFLGTLNFSATRSPRLFFSRSEKESG